MSSLILPFVTRIDGEEKESNEEYSVKFKEKSIKTPMVLF